MDTPSSFSWLPHLLRDMAPKVLWEFLSPKPKSPDYDIARLQARATTLQGFQSTPANLRHPTVQKRLLNWFERHPEPAKSLLETWAKSEKEWLSTLEAEMPDDALFFLLRAHGKAKCLIGASYRELEMLRTRIEALEPQGWEAEVIAPEPVEEVAEEPTPEQWRERALKAETDLERRTGLTREQNTELETLRERLRAASKEIERLKKEERQRETAATKKFDLAQKAAAAQLAEVKKHDERESRRLHAAEKTRDELDSTAKVLRKQVRHLNQLLDEQAKKIASLEARIKEREPAKPEADPRAVDAVAPSQTTQEKADKPVKVARPTPLDELFRWVADGHEFRATPRETMRALDRGDEDFAFRAQMALDGISPKDIPKKNAFLTRLREQDGYYVRVLTEPAQRALVDASNVVRATKNKYGKGELKNLIEIKRELRRLGFFPIEFIADASLRYNVDNINAYNEMINRSEVEVTTPGVEADEVLVRKARSGGGYVVTNDAKFHFKVSPDLAPPSISFRVLAGTVIVDEF